MGAAVETIETYAHWSSQGDTWRDRPVLVFEPGTLLRRLLTSTLRSNGAKKVIAAKTLDEAKASLQLDLPGLVIADWDAQEPDPVRALEFLKHVRWSSDPAYRDVPFIMVSQRRSHIDVERARDAGASEFLMKPLPMNTFMQRIEAAADPRQFMKTTRFNGPDRRRKRASRDLPYKRKIDVATGLIDPLDAARNACMAMAYEVARDGCQHARRVAVSLKRYLDRVSEFNASENEIVEMHRAALVQLERANGRDEPYRIGVVSGLEEVVQKRLNAL